MHVILEYIQHVKRLIAAAKGELSAAKAELAALREQYRQSQVQVRLLQARVAELEERLNRNSRNASLPPSKDQPTAPKDPPKPPTGRRRGGQPGHRGKGRKLVPMERVDELVTVKPECCKGCGHLLSGEDPSPYRHQVTEIPQLRPHITGYRLHMLRCPHCGEKTCASLPEGVSNSAFGFRLQAMVVLCTGVCLCVYGTTTPVMFWSALKSANVADGSLARFLILRTRDDYPDGGGGNVIQPLPEALIQAARSIAEGGSMGDGNLQGVTSRPETPVEPMIVPMDKPARVLFARLGAQVMDRLRESRATPWSAILARVWENAAKAALIRGVSANPVAPVIRRSDALWAIGLVRYAVNTLIEDVERHLADNQTEQNHKRVLDLIRKAGRQGIPKNALTRRTQFLSGRERTEVLQALLEGGQIVAESGMQGKSAIITYRTPP